MNHRALRLLGTVAAVIVAVSPVPSGAEAQPRAAADAATPRTPWGDPDLQGIWNNGTITPLERPADRADQAFLDAEEFAAVEQQARDRVDRENAPSAQNRGCCRWAATSVRTTATGRSRTRRSSAPCARR